MGVKILGAQVIGVREHSSIGMTRSLFTHAQKIVARFGELNEIHLILYFTASVLYGSSLCKDAVHCQGPAFFSPEGKQIGAKGTNDWER